MSVAEQTSPQNELGRARLRVEDRRFVTGQGRYVEDVALPGTLEMAVVRSPHPHARIVRIDATAALAVPGVHAVLTGADAPPLTRFPLIPVGPDTRIPPFELLADPVVRSVGTPVVAVIADSRATAYDA